MVIYDSLHNSFSAKQRFFVYCKRPCAKMTPGKLRVRCADCKSSSFELTQVSVHVEGDETLHGHVVVMR